MYCNLVVVGGGGSGGIRCFLSGGVAHGCIFANGVKRCRWRARTRTYESTASKNV